MAFALILSMYFFSDKNNGLNFQKRCPQGVGGKEGGDGGGGKLRCKKDGDARGTF